MKMKYSIIASIALLIATLSACQNEDVISNDDIVKFNFGITSNYDARSNPIGTADEQKQFNAGDMVLVTTATFNDDAYDKIIYKFDGTNWKSLDGKFFRWQGDIMNFISYYPCDENGIYQNNNRTVYDQTTVDSLAKADWMKSNQRNIPRGQIINIEFGRISTRIVVNIANFNNQYDASTKVTDVRIFDKANTVSTEYIKPYAIGDGGVGSKYIAIINKDLISKPYVSLKVGNEVLEAALTPSNPVMFPISGYSYTFNLTVGKQNIGIISTSVNPWTETSIALGNTDEMSLLEPIGSTYYYTGPVLANFQCTVIDATPFMVTLIGRSPASSAYSRIDKNVEDLKARLSTVDEVKMSIKNDYIGVNPDIKIICMNNGIKSLLTYTYEAGGIYNFTVVPADGNVGSDEEVYFYPVVTSTEHAPTT